MSGSLVSPGVKVSIIDQSAYGTSGPGTVPLIVIATSANKIAPGGTTVAPGTLPQNAGDLYLITSQRDALQTFGNPTFYSAAGSVQYNNELNELGLFTLYTYLGVATTAYVIRADIDLDQLIPTTVAPTGPTVNGTYWLDTSQSTWGIFQSNGNINPAYTWQSQTPSIISNAAQLNLLVQGNSTVPIVSGSAPCITSSGNLVINGIAVGMTAGQSLAQVASNINTNTNLQLIGISAVIFVRQGKYSPTASATGDIFSLRVISSNYQQPISFVNSTNQILIDLGFTTNLGDGNPSPANYIQPVTSFGSTGTYAINTLYDAITNDEGEVTFEMNNTMFQMLTLTTSNTTTNWWFEVGTTESENPGFSWTSAVPSVLIGSTPNPTFNANDMAIIQIGTGSPLTITVPSLNPTLSGVVGAINTALNSGSGTNAVASITTIGGNNYLTITNYDASQIFLHDIVDQYGNGVTPPGQPGSIWADAGISTSNNYWATVTGSVANPTYNAATLQTLSASVVTPGSNYLNGDILTVVGGIYNTQTALTVASLQVVGASPNSAGSGYRVNDTLTFGSNDINYTTPAILVVDGIDGSGGITSVSILGTQSGQYTGVTPPTTNTSPSATSGSGIGATVDLTWGINTVTVSTPGNYSVYPTNPISITGGSGSDALFNITSTWLTSDSFSIALPGLSPTIVHVPALTSSESSVSVADVANQINLMFPVGPIVASVSNNKLVITNNNGTAFAVQDLHGTPLHNSGIATGTKFARGLIYQGYQPTNTVPSTPAALKANNVWINTTAGGLGANIVVKRYENGTWVQQNTVPNTGSIPLYSSDAAANTAFGALKGLGSIYGQYNAYGSTPSIGNIMLRVWSGSAWESLVYVPSLVAPAGPPLDGTLWYNTALKVDIMVNNGQEWVGYRNMYPGTDPNGPILSSATPTTQSTGAALVDYDIWVNTDIVPYPAIYRYNASTATWVLIDNTDHINSAGVIFADARYTSNGMTDGSTLPSAMVLSNYVDPDCPDALLYPPYILLFNTRYSTYNVKRWTVNYFPQNYGTEYPTDTWVTFSGNAPDGTPYMGSAAQRAVIVNALNAAIEDSTDARAEQNYFNLISTPGYPECIAQMVQLNVDINNVAFVVGDTPSTLQPTGTSIQNWATNAANAATDGSVGLVTHSSYLALWYPWGLTSDLQGNNVVVPPSLIALTTIAYSDSVSYVWFAPAGFNRGLVSVVSSVGYLDSSGNYIPVTLNQGQRDVLYSNDINPIAYMVGRGLVVFGQKTLDPLQTALDRISVARLCAYLSYNLANLAQPFLFEQNDSTTQQNVTAVFNSYLQSLVGLRALYDFSVVCDSSNNTPATIDANQLWIDVAIQPEIAIEFIYIPVRVLATGAPLPGGGVG
jgi:hypothetical protein